MGASGGTALRLIDIERRANRIMGFAVAIDGGVSTEHVYGGLEMAHLVHIELVRAGRSLCRPASDRSHTTYFVRTQDFAQQLGVSEQHDSRMKPA